MLVKTRDREIKITAVGVVDISEDWTLGAEKDKQYKNYSKSELFCVIYQRIIPEKSKGRANKYDTL